MRLPIAAVEVGVSPLKQAGQQGDQGGAQQDDAAAGHELLHSLALCLCVIKKQ